MNFNQELLSTLPKLDFFEKGVYVVAEITDGIEQHPNNFKPVACFRSNEAAVKYMSGKIDHRQRKIYGPIPLIESSNDSKPMFEFPKPMPRTDPIFPEFLDPRPNMKFEDPDEDNPLKFGKIDFTLPKPKNPDFNQYRDF